MAVNNSLARKQNTFSTFLTNDAVKNKINQTLGGKDGQRFMSAILSAVSVNPVLQECEHGSVLSSALLGESLRLSPSPQLGQYYMVPFNDKKKGKVATFILGYKGYIQLAMRTGQYKDLDCLEIREGEYLGRDGETAKHKFSFISDPIERMNRPVVGYMAYFELINGFRKVVYWTKEEMEVHADTYSKAFKMTEYRKLKDGKVPQSDMWKYSSFWYKSFDEMAFKTLIRHLISRWGAMSIQMEKALEADNQLDFNDTYNNYIDSNSDNEQLEEAGEEEPIDKERLKQTAEQAKTKYQEFKQQSLDESDPLA